MKRITWNIYSAFRCIAEKCPDSCCQGWEVDVDDASAAAYRAMEGALGDRLRQVLRDGENGAYMVLENGRCPMWREDKLCRLQAETSHDTLCRVCREYPRLYMDYGDFAEWGLELSCPEAARLLFSGLSVTEEEVPGGEPPEYDGEIMDILQRSREEILRFWEETTLPVNEALAVTLLYAHQVQGAIDGGEELPLAAENCLADAKKYANRETLTNLPDYFKGLEILTERWKNRLSSPAPGNWSEMLKIPVVYFIRRYWLQAVWDYDLVCRAKFILSACILLNTLGGDLPETAQLFSKEIENDPENYEAILDAAYTHPAFTDANLLGLLSQ